MSAHHTNCDVLSRVGLTILLTWIVVVTWALWPMIRVGLTHHHLLTTLFGG